MDHCHSIGQKRMQLRKSCMSKRWLHKGAFAEFPECPRPRPTRNGNDVSQHEVRMTTIGSAAALFRQDMPHLAGQTTRYDSRKVS